MQIYYFYFHRIHYFYKSHISHRHLKQRLDLFNPNVNAFRCFISLIIVIKRLTYKLPALATSNLRYSSKRPTRNEISLCISRVVSNKYWLSSRLFFFNRLSVVVDISALTVCRYSCHSSSISTGIYAPLY